MTSPSILGHTAAITELLEAAHGPRFHHAWLFTGPEGVGKATVAKAAAARLLAESAGPPPEGNGLALDPHHRIARMIEARSHPDYKLVEREVWLPKPTDTLMPYGDRKGDEKRGRNIRIAQMRWLEPMLHMSPSLSQRRIIIVDAADDLEKSSANAFLKNLEEPPAHTIFFLISHMPGKLLPTIRSRCRVLRFAPLSDAEMQGVLRAQLPGTDGDERAALIAAAEGAPGKALALAGLDIMGIDVALATIARTGDPSNAARSALAAQFAAKSSLPRYEAFLKRAPSFIATQARTRQGSALRQAVDAYAQAQTIAATAPIHNLDPQSAVFEICGLVAGLAK